MVWFYNLPELHWLMGGHCGRDRTVVGFTTTYAISAYHHCDFVSSNLDRGEVYNIM